MCTAISVGGEVQPSIKFSKRGFSGKEKVDVFQGGCSLYIEKKLKSELFNDKKVFELKCFFLLYITKNLNWENLTKNLATFKR